MLDKVVHYAISNFMLVCKLSIVVTVNLQLTHNSNYKEGYAITLSYRVHFNMRKQNKQTYGADVKVPHRDVAVYFAREIKSFHERAKRCIYLNTATFQMNLEQRQLVK